MSKRLKGVLLILLGIFVVLQLIPSNRPANETPQDYDFFVRYEVPAEVEDLIRNSCYDCHSQEVSYPWYAYVAPSSWLVARDVREGRSNLDFSNFDRMDKKDRIRVAGEISEEVEEGTMPMAIYTFIHGSARLEETDRNRLIEWSDNLAEKIFDE
jgi:hypothetical protein